MDQNSTNGTDKRNWRERLGIGSKELPRVAEEFRDEEQEIEAPEPVRAAPTRAPSAVAKPAPMAPRQAPKAPRVAVPVAEAPKRMAPVVPDVLAEKLKIQRAAAERLAEQRVQAARERAEAANTIETSAPRQSAPARTSELSNAPKPKFTFAEEEPPARVSPPPMPQRQMAPPNIPQSRPVPPPAYQPQMQSPLSPPRPNLGGERPVMPQRTIQPPTPAPQNYQSQYRAQPQPQPQQGYRPIDPSTGYPTQPSMNPAYNRQQYGAPPQQNSGPRLGMPAPQRNEDYGNDAAFEQEPRPNARMMRPPMRPPLQAPQQTDDYGDDVFEQPAARPMRRASANEYTQAYREVETGYDDEPRRSRIPLILSLLGLALVAGLAGWYFTAGKSTNVAVTGTTPPVIEAPEQPAKVSVEPSETEVQTNAANTPNKKQIYDRIVGDQEVLGGQLTPTEETPIEPETQSQPIPEPAAGNADEALPLPLPPPPGEGAGTQGALPTDANQVVANVTPASANGEEIEAIAPAPGDLTNSAAATSEQATPPTTQPAESEQISDVEPVVAPKKKIKPIVAATKPKVTAPKNLGSKPVVLVPPVKKAAKVESVALEDSNDDLPASVNPMQDSSGAETATNEIATPAAPKKKRTLADLFRNEDAVAAPETQVAAIEEPEITKPVAPAPKKIVAAPVAPAASGYVVQLASFKSQAEANAEYKRMTAKHSSILGGLNSNINQATVAGSTRYRLALGPLSSRDAASQVCSKLFAAGERDCLIRKQ